MSTTLAVMRKERHGTTTEYARGCRCDECRAAVRAYRKAKKDGTFVPRPHEPTQCTGPECDRLARYRTPQPLCGPHHQQLDRGVKLTPIRRYRVVRHGVKECSRCGQVLPVDEFHPKPGGNVSSACKACISILNRATRYRISFDEAATLLRGECATCGSTDRLHVDHCHDTGKVRGVLCHNCNTVLTKHMTPAILRRLADYLES